MTTRSGGLAWTELAIKVAAPPRVRRMALLALLPPLLGFTAEQVYNSLLLWSQDLVAGLLWPANDTPTLGAASSIEAADLPLRTSGRWLHDRNGRKVRLRCVNWYGAHLETLVVGGLQQQPLATLAYAIRALGFNCVRLPYSLELHLRPARPSKDALRANPALWNATGLEIMDRTVAALTAAKLLVVLNNHQSRAMWCCSESDGEGLWYTPEYPEQAWLDSLRDLALRYRSDPFVIGYDLRNEPRLSLFKEPAGQYRRPEWGTGRNDTDWAAAALRGAQAVSEKDPQALVFIEGLHFAMDLAGLRRGGRLHLLPELRGRVVYEAHDYCWYHPELLYAWGLHWLCLGWSASLAWETWWNTRRSPLKGHSSACSGYWRHLAVGILVAWAISAYFASYRYFEAVLSERWGFLLDEGEAPVWLGEFGTNGPRVTADWWMEIGEVAWWRHLMRYLREHEVDYAYWAWNGDKAGEDETFGLLEPNYATLRHPWIIEMLP